MPQNVEVKARVHNIDVLLQKATELCQMEAEVIEQSDTFFKVKNGRLKLRQFKEGTGGELIFYERSNNCGPKVSTYMKSLVNDPLSLKQVLSMALEVEGNISKKRMLFYHNQTRIHIDKVCNLGDFLELEVVLEDGQCLESGMSIANKLLALLGVTADDLVPGSYLDNLNVSNKCHVAPLNN